MATVFWDRKGILLIDFMPPGTTINSDRYCDTLRKLKTGDPEPPERKAERRCDTAS